MVRKILRYMTSLFLMFILVLLPIGLFAKTVLLNPDFYKKQLNTTSYYSELRHEIDNGLAYLSLITSIPAEILTDTVSDDAVYALSNSNIFQSTQFMKQKTDDVSNTLDLKVIEVPLNGFIDKYAAQNDFEVDETQREQIKEVAEQVASIVTNHTVLFNINAVKKFGEFQRFRRIIYFFYSYWYFFALAAVLCVALLFALNPKRFRRGFLWTGSSMIAASLMIITPAILALLYRIPYRFNIATSYLKTAIRTFTMGYIRFFLYGGIGLFFIGLFSLVLYVRLSNQARLEQRVME